MLEDAVDAARAVGPDWPITVDAVPSAEVIGDPMALRQVIDNLLANVRTHTPSGTPAAVRLRIDAAADGPLDAREVVLEVADTGPGLDAADVDRVFERFYRVDTSRSRDRGGSGLGLAVVAALVAAHGGSVEVESTPGEGATFRVRLQHAPANEAVEAGGAGESPRACRLLARRTREPGRPLLAVRCEPLGRVGTTEAVELVRERRVEDRAHRAVPVVQGVLRPPDRALRAVGQLGRDPECLVEQRVVVHAERDQPDPLGFLAASASGR